VATDHPEFGTQEALLGPCGGPGGRRRLVATLGRPGGAGQVFAHAEELGAAHGRPARRRLLRLACRDAHAARSRHRRRRHHRRGRRPAAPRDPSYEGASPTSARRRSGCARAARSTGATCACSPRRGGVDGCTHVIHLAAIVGGIANFHKLPLTLTEVNGALYNAVVRAAVEAQGLERFVYVSSSMVFEQATEYPTTRSTSGPARSPLGLRFSKLQGEVHVRAADDEFGLPWTICRRSTPTARARCPRTSPGSRTWSPT
jgi:hypothetical protein